MPSDYKRIAEENIREYGTAIGRYGPVLLAQLYSDRTHFVYELLQNAEDARATEVTFHLYENRLEIVHNGRLFNEADVRGICGLVEGTKAADLNKIGKFGIGFKSVFGYTDSPEVHSRDEHFTIKQYVRPEAVEPRSIPSGITTLFVLPFNRSEVTAAVAHAQIGARLRSLSLRTLLFLRNIMEISWQIEGGPRGTYLRERKPRESASHVVLVGESQGQETEEEDWLVFERHVKAETGEVLKVEAAFRLVKEPKTNQERIVAAHDSRLVVFFPTEKMTYLEFMIQGPYRTTPARDNIPDEDAWNQQLIQETALLVVDSLQHVKRMGLLTVSFLEALPIHEARHYRVFVPIFEAVKKAFKDYPLLPTYNADYVTAGNSKLARGTGLRELLPPAQLKQLFGVRQDITWLSEDITEDKTPALREYLRRELLIDEVTPDTFASRFNSSFIEKQTDEWLIDLYHFLADQEAVWRAPRYASDRPGPLREKPFIRLQNGNHVAPFGKDGLPNAYISTEEVTEFPIVKREIIADDQARAFLEKKLGIGQPDIVAEVLKNVLPKYANRKAGVFDDEEHQRDLQMIVRGLQTDSTSKKQALILKLKETPFLLATQVGASEIAYKRPGEIYAHTDELETYFESEGSAWLLTDTVSDQSGREMDWSFLGVENKPRRIPFAANLTNDEKWALRGNSYSYTREMEATDFELDGLSDFLDGFQANEAAESKSKARILWEFLLLHLREQYPWNKRSFLQGIYKWFYYSERAAVFDAHFVKTLRVVKWLPSKKGELCAPSSMSLDDLPDDFERDETLINALKIRPAVLRIVAEELGVDPEDINLIRHHPEEFARFKASLESLNYGSGPGEDGDTDRLESHDESGANLQYRQAFEEVFAHPQGREPTSPFSAASQVTNPGLRRERTQEEINQDRHNEPAHELRFERVTRKAWEAKDSYVRTFLRQEYDGACQVCGRTFIKRDGEPYFEGLYLVSRTRAKWIDRPGNVLCLCPTCCAKFLYGSLEAPEVLEHLTALRTVGEGGNGETQLGIRLCGEKAHIRFSERHLIELQELLKASPDDE